MLTFAASPFGSRFHGKLYRPQHPGRQFMCAFGSGINSLGVEQQALPYCTVVFVETLLTFSTPRAVPLRVIRSFQRTGRACDATNAWASSSGVCQNRYQWLSETGFKAVLLGPDRAGPRNNEPCGLTSWHAFLACRLQEDPEANCKRTSSARWPHAWDWEILR